MKVLAFITIFILIQTETLCTAKLQSFPKGYRVREDNEAVFKYRANNHVSIFIVQMASTYDFDVIVKPGSSIRSLLFAVENLTYDDDIEEPSLEDIKALQYPFEVTLSDEGEWSNVKMNPKETAYSMDIKDDLLTLLIFNVTEIEQLTHEEDHSLETEDTEIPLGSMCRVKQKFKNYADSLQIHISVKRDKCIGASEIQVDGTEVTNDSNFEIKMLFEKSPLKFKKAEINMKVSIQTTPLIKMRINHNVEFTRFRSFKTSFDEASLTESYTPEEFNKRLEYLKQVKEQQEKSK